MKSGFGRWHPSCVARQPAIHDEIREKPASDEVLRTMSRVDPQGSSSGSSWGSSVCSVTLNSQVDHNTLLNAS
jgi:hypothetical protein